VPLAVSLVTPEREVWSGEADFVVARPEGGEIGILPGHAPFLGSLKHALVKIQTSDEQFFFAVHGGFIEVFEDRVSILAPVAELASEIDISRAQRAKDEAEAALRMEETDEVRQALLRAEARLRTAAEAGLIVG
jgi:F-type H+-transporting ATPase subunit epsilon